MKTESIYIFAYALLIFIGGLIGYFVSHSPVSIISSSIFTVLLLTSVFFMRKGHPSAYYSAMILAGFLFLFFGYRFFLTYKIFPGAVMCIISGALFAYLAARRKSVA